MSNKADELTEDDIPETDFSGGVRGKYYERAMNETNKLRPAGLAEGEFVVPEDFDDPLPDDLLDAFEGR